MQYCLDRIKKPLACYLIVFILFFYFHATLWAQDEYNFALGLTIADQEAVPGNIIAQDSSGSYVRATIENSNRLVGVLSDTSVLLYESVEGAGSPVVTEGTTTVTVATTNGPIQIGDLIVASSLPGIGQRGSGNNEYIIGTALASFTGENAATQVVDEKTIATGTIPLYIQIRTSGASKAGAFTNLVDQVGNLFFQSSQTPQQTQILFRYLAAAIVAATSIAVSFRAFGKSISNSIEAMGRNPLARRQIQGIIILNAGLIAVISLSGIVLALAIIQF